MCNKLPQNLVSQSRYLQFLQIRNLGVDSSCSGCFTGCNQGAGWTAVTSTLKWERIHFPGHWHGPPHRAASRAGSLLSLEVRDRSVFVKLQVVNHYWFVKLKNKEQKLNEKVLLPSREPNSV